MLDVRHQNDFEKGHIPRSIFIGLDGSFAPWVGALIADIKQPILLVTPNGKEEETITRLSRVGFDQVIGYLEGGFNAWEKALKNYDTVDSITAKDFEQTSKNSKVAVFDVRKEGEYLSEHVIDALNTPLDYINNHLSEFPNNQNFYLHCAGGYRSMIAASILKSRGIHNLINIQDGFDAIKEEDIKISDYVCPSTL